MTKIGKNLSKLRCFFANKRFRELVCDSNHKKRCQKSPILPSQRTNGCSVLVIPFVFN